MSGTREKEGCKKCMIAFRKEGEGIKFLAPEPLTGLKELTYTYTYAEGSDYADNELKIYKKKATGADISLTFLDIPTKLLSKILGKKYSQGGTTTNVNDKAVPVAILFQETYDNGDCINTVFYNVKLARDENSAKTTGENIEFTSITLTGKAIPFTNEHTEGDIDFRMDSAEDDIDQSKFDAFFKAVQYLNGEVQQAATLSLEDREREVKQVKTVKNSVKKENE